MSDTDIEHLRRLGDQKVICKASQLVQFIEAAAALAARDAEIERLKADHEASIDELFRSLGITTHSLTAIQNALSCGPHLDDKLATIAALKARLAAAEDWVAGLRAAGSYVSAKEPPHD